MEESNEEEVILTAGELADVIEDFDNAIRTDEKHRAENTRLLLALLFDMRSEIVYALRLIDAEEEIKAP